VVAASRQFAYAQSPSSSPPPINPHTQQLRAADGAGQPEPTRRLAGALLAFSEEANAVLELEHLKHVIAQADAAIQGLSPTDPQLAAVLRLLLPLLVQDGSRLLHRHLLGWVRRLQPEGARAAAGAVITEQLLGAARSRLNQGCQQADGTAAPSSSTASAAAAAAEQQGAPEWVRPALSVSQAVASLTQLTIAAPWVAPAAGPLLLMSARAMDALLAAAEAGAPLSPRSMEQLQESITAVIFLLSHYAHDLTGSEEGEAAIFEICRAGLRALRSHALVREAMVSAAVAVWHATLQPGVPPGAAALVFARGLALDGSRGWVTGAGRSGGDSASSDLRMQERQHNALLPSQQLQTAWLEASHIERRMATELERIGGEAAVAAARKAHGSCMGAQLAQASPLGRLCALKGVMMSLPPAALCHNLNAVSGSDAANGGTNGSSSATWCLLIDGALPAAAVTLQTAGDSHFKFHAAGTLLVALQRCRAVWQQLASTAAAADEDGSGNGEGAAALQGREGAELVMPWLMPDTRSYLMNVLWALIDEPVVQTLRQVQLGFEHLFALLTTQAACAATLGCPPPPGCAAADARAFLLTAADAVLRMTAGRKGRYAPLLSLLPHVGASWMVQREPRLVEQVLRAMCNDMVANTATEFFRGLLAKLKAEASEAERSRGGSGGGGGGRGGLLAVAAATVVVEEAEAPEVDAAPAWCAAWLPGVVRALSGPDERLRTYVASHGLPVLLHAEPGLLHTLLRALLQQPGGAGEAADAAAAHGCMAAVVVLLRAGRQLQLIGDLSDLDRFAAAAGAAGGAAGGAPSARELLLSCVASSSEPLRLACLELACVHPRCAWFLRATRLHAACCMARLACNFQSSAHPAKLTPELLTRQCPPPLPHPAPPYTPGPLSPRVPWSWRSSAPGCCSACAAPAPPHAPRRRSCWGSCSPAAARRRTRCGPGWAARGRGARGTARPRSRLRGAGGGAGWTRCLPLLTPRITTTATATAAARCHRGRRGRRSWTRSRWAMRRSSACRASCSGSQPPCSPASTRAPPLSASCLRRTCC